MDYRWLLNKKIFIKALLKNKSHYLCELFQFRILLTTEYMINAIVQNKFDMSVVILSPNRFSLYTICVTELLLQNNVNVSAIVVKRLLNPNRFINEFNYYGFRLIKKIWKKLILRKKSYSNMDFETIADYMKKENISFRKVEDFKYKVWN